MDNHSHSHNHSHGHSGCPGHNAPYRILLISIVIIILFAIVEAVVGWWSQSLALMGDAGHMGSDALALGIAAFAAWIATKPPSKKHSYGLGRAEIVAAWISSLMMLMLSIVIIVEAVSRLHEHVVVKSLPLMIVAALGIFVNLAVAWLLTRSQRTLNIRAALLHVIGDLLGSVAALVAGAVIHYTGWYPIDPILSIFISILIMISSIRLLRESLQVLMEGVPPYIQIEEVSVTLKKIDGVNNIHDLHIWTLSSGVIVLSAHVDITEFSSWPTLLEELRNTIKHKYDIDHVTLQPEPEVIDCQPCSGTQGDLSGR
jgi:cobalt-zinc-cadmium efflux system protein